MSEQLKCTQMENGRLPETLTVQEVQKILKLGRNAVYNLIHSHSFPVIRVGNLLRIPREPFYAWLATSHVVRY